MALAKLLPILLLLTGCALFPGEVPIPGADMVGMASYIDQDGAMHAAAVYYDEQTKTYRYYPAVGVKRVGFQRVMIVQDCDVTDGVVVWRME